MYMGDNSILPPICHIFSYSMAHKKKTTNFISEVQIRIYINFHFTALISDTTLQDKNCQSNITSSVPKNRQSGTLQSELNADPRP